jgi:UDP-glucose 4-epimerase
VRALVTGGAGFIGSHVVDHLLARGDEVHVLDNLATGRREHVPDAAAFHAGDIRSDAEAAFDAARPDVCFHLAAQADVTTSVQRPDFDAEVNVLGTVRVLEAARRHGTHVVFSSTAGALYGECKRPAREDDPRLPLAPYGMSKLAGEEYLGGWNRLHQMGNVVLRLANVYGPRQDSSLEGGVVAIFLERMARDEPTQIFGDGAQTRDFLFVGDVVAGMLAAVGRDGGLYNLGTGVETSVAELHALCRRVSGSPREPELAAARAGEIRRSVVDASLAARDLGWRPTRSLEDGLRETWEWTREELG